MSATIKITDVEKRFGAVRTLKGVSLEVEAGEFLTLVGPSGCGKSTLLRIVAGLAEQTAGTIEIDGRNVDALPPKARDIAMVFQSYALYPHMSVAENIATPLETRRLPALARVPMIGRLVPGSGAIRRAVATEVRSVAESVRIETLLDRRPSQLSGGQRQRVALARAMVRHPRAFLMDEPLSNLDAGLRVHMRGELSDIHRRLGATFVYVTHDQIEAMTMSTRVAVMMEGEIVQIAAPHDLYRDPIDVRVARFIGSPEINLAPARAEAGRVRLGGIVLPIEVAAEGAITLGIRPEALRLDDDRADFWLAGRLHRVETLGHDCLLHLDHDYGGDGTFVLRAAVAEIEALRRAGRLDGTLTLAVRAADVFVFGADGRRLAAAASHGRAETVARRAETVA